jgi:NADPH2 dehydrogenase
MESKLFTSFQIRNTLLRNRVVMPPMVNFGWTGPDGVITEQLATQYEAIAKGGAGMIIAEATCVMEEGRVAPDQPGIWNDTQRDAWSRMAAACRKQGAVTLLQLHHAGLKTSSKVAAEALGPSPDPKNASSRALTPGEILKIRDAFISGALRAEQAGFNGIEIHGAHGYLLNQFASTYYNHREDELGTTPEGRIRLSLEVIRGIRKACRPDFIIGYRLGANSPFLDDGIRIARTLQEEDLDYLHVSHGGNQENLPQVPEDFPYTWMVWSASAVKKEVRIPVIAVNGVKTPERAAYLVEHDMCDLVSIGRDQLTDYEWVRKAMADLPINYCIACKPACKRYIKPERCPAVYRQPAEQQQR